MKKFLYILILVLSFHVANSQQLTTISGQLFDIDNKPYFPATIEILEGDSIIIKTTVDMKGQFMLSIPSKTTCMVKASAHVIWNEKNKYLSKSTRQVLKIGTDTIKVALQLDIDTLETNYKERISYLDLNGSFTCLGELCLDSNGKEFGIQTGYYCAIVQSGTYYSAVVNSRKICTLRENGDVFVFSIENDPREVIINEIFDIEKVKAFFEENFLDGKLKDWGEIKINGKKINTP